MVKRPPPIRTDASNRFAHHTMRIGNHVLVSLEHNLGFDALHIVEII